MYRADVVTTGFDELYSYDGLDQLSSFDRGTLNTGRAALTLAR